MVCGLFTSSTHNILAFISVQLPQRLKLCWLLQRDKVFPPFMIMAQAISLNYYPVCCCDHYSDEHFGDMVFMQRQWGEKKKLCSFHETAQWAELFRCFHLDKLTARWFMQRSSQITYFSSNHPHRHPLYKRCNFSLANRQRRFSPSFPH